MKVKRIVFLLLRIVISVGLLTYFIWSTAAQYGGIGKTLEHFAAGFVGAPVHWLIMAMLLNFVGLTLVSLRWKILLQGQQVESSFRHLFSIYFMASFFNLVLPATIGGDAMRTVESRRLTGSTTISAMVVIIERLTGMFALVIISMVGLTLSFFIEDEQNGYAWIIIGVSLGCFLMLILATHPKITPRFIGLTQRILPAKFQQLLERAFGAVNAYHKHPRFLLAAQGVSIFVQLNVVLYYFLIALALNQEVEPLTFMVKVPVIIFLLMTVPAINGLGIRTAGFKGLVGFSNVYALLLETIDLGFRFILGTMGGILYLFYHRGESERLGKVEPDGKD